MAHFPSPLRNCLAALAVSTLAFGSAGCDELFGAFQDDTNLVHVLSTHHSSPQDGSFPSYGIDGGFRVFDTDQGWTVTLTEGYVVTSSVGLQQCNGGMTGVDFHYGQLPEDLRNADLETETLGSKEAPAGKYCSVIVTYSPYVPLDARSASDHEAPESDMVNGASLYIKGVADKKGKKVPFEIRSERSLDVILDVSALQNGEPFQIKADSSFPPELLLSKTYDRFFDGIDFANMAGMDLEEQVWAVLDAETRVSLGTVPVAG